MSRRLSAVAALAVALLLTVMVLPSEAARLPRHRAWLRATNVAMNGSRALVDHRRAAPGERLAINLDIDNTSLQTKYRPGRAVPVTRRFARYAAAHGVAVMFNTGRTKGLDRVAAHLRRVGFPVNGICGRSYGESLTASKQRCRRRYVSLGYTIIANVGNRSTDFVGGNYERAFRLPDYGGRLG